MRIRVEVATQRPERVVEIGDVVAHLVGDRHRVFGDAGYVMSRSDQLVHQNVHALQRFDGSAELVGQLGHVIQPALGDLQVLQLPGILHAEQERNRRVLERCALRPRNALYPSDSLDAEDALGQLVQDQEVRRIAHVVIGLDHQHFGHHARLREMPLRGGHSDVAGGVLRYVVAVDVAHLVTRQREQADHGDRTRRGENRCRPTHDGGAHAPPTADAVQPLGLQQTESAADRNDRRDQGQRDGDRDQHAHRAGRAQGLEDRQPGKAEAVRRARDRQAGRQNHMGDTAIGGEVRGLAILTVVACLVIAPDEKDSVVGARRDRERHQDIGGKRRKFDDIVQSKEGDNASGGG